MSTQGETQRIALLAEGLLVKTLAGELNWTEAKDEPAAFRLELPSGIVRVASIDRDGAPPYRLMTYGRAGGAPLDVVDTREPTAASAPIRRLYEVVSRRVRGADQVLDGLLKDVGTPSNSAADDDDIPF